MNIKKRRFKKISLFLTFSIFYSTIQATPVPVNKFNDLCPSWFDFITETTKNIIYKSVSSDSKNEIPYTKDKKVLRSHLKKLSHLSPQELAKILWKLPEDMRMNAIDIIRAEWEIGGGFIPTLWVNWWAAIIVIGVTIIGGIIYFASKKEEKLPIVEKYPDSQYPYRGKKNKSGDYPRNERGEFVDKHGDGWRWHPIDQEWDVQVDGGKEHINVDVDGSITHGAQPDEVGRKNNPNWIPLNK